MTAPAARSGERPEPRQVQTVAVLAALVAFAPSLWDGFVFDDDELIVRNPFVHGLGHVARCFRTDLWDTASRTVGDGSPHFYRPLVCAANAVNYAMGGGSPFPFHLTNVVCHALSAFLAARLFLRWTEHRGAALAAAVLFAVHPAHTESVVWISGRTDVFCLLFLLAAVEGVVSFATSARVAIGVGAVVAFFAALASKESAAAFPLFLGLEWLAARRTGAEPAALGRLGRAALSFGVLAVAYVVCRRLFLPLLPDGGDIPFPPLVRAGYVLLTVGYYAARLAFPWPQTFYFRPVAFDGVLPVLSPAFVVLGAAAVATWGVLFARSVRRDPVNAGLLALFAALLAPALNVVPTYVPTTSADRFLHLPLLPLAAYLGRALPARVAGLEERLARLVGACLAAIAVAVVWIRCLDYTSDEAMWRQELEVNPDSPLALGKLAEATANRGDPGGARTLLRKALSPEALRHRLLASPTKYYFALLELAGAALPDGDAPALTSLLGEIQMVLSGRIPETTRRAKTLDLPPVPADDHFAIHVANARAHLAAAGALVASRLPADAVVRQLVAQVPEGAPLGAAGRHNLALALARASEYGAARAELALATEEGLPNAVAHAVSDAIDRAEALRRDAHGLPEPRSSLARAEAFTLLGAHLRAARVLRRTTLDHPEDPALIAPYFEALVASRLDEDAGTVAARLPGVAPGERLAAEQGKLSPAVRSLSPVPASTPWWTPWTSP